MYRYMYRELCSSLRLVGERSGGPAGSSIAVAINGKNGRVGHGAVEEYTKLAPAAILLRYTRMARRYPR